MLEYRECEVTLMSDKEQRKPGVEMCKRQENTLITKEKWKERF